MSACRACKADLAWVETARTHRRVPVDIRPVSGIAFVGEPEPGRKWARGIDAGGWEHRIYTTEADGSPLQTVAGRPIVTIQVAHHSTCPFQCSESRARRSRK